MGYVALRLCKFSCFVRVIFFFFFLFFLFVYVWNRFQTVVSLRPTLKCRLNAPTGDVMKDSHQQSIFFLFYYQVHLNERRPPVAKCYLHGRSIGSALDTFKLELKLRSILLGYEKKGKRVALMRALSRGRASAVSDICSFFSSSFGSNCLASGIARARRGRGRCSVSPNGS